MDLDYNFTKDLIYYVFESMKDGSSLYYDKRPDRLEEIKKFIEGVLKVSVTDDSIFINKYNNIRDGQKHCFGVIEAHDGEKNYLIKMKIKNGFVKDLEKSEA